MDALLDRQRAGVERDLGVERGLVGVVDAREALDLAGAGLGVEALDVAPLADLDRGVAVDLDEVAPGNPRALSRGPR